MFLRIYEHFEITPCLPGKSAQETCCAPDNTGWSDPKRPAYPPAISGENQPQKQHQSAGCQFTWMRQRQRPAIPATANSGATHISRK